MPVEPSGPSAIVRALLDEVDRATRALSTGEQVDERVVEELARLGCRILEAASALTAIVDAREAADEP
jgi:hypothetical protein